MTQKSLNPTKRRKSLQHFGERMLQQLNQEKHHFDKKQDYSSKFNLMKAHGACGFDEMQSIVAMKPYKPGPLLAKKEQNIRRASFSMKDVFSSGMFSTKALARVDEKENMAQSSRPRQKPVKSRPKSDLRVRASRITGRQAPTMTSQLKLGQKSDFDRVLGDDFILGALCK